MTPAQASDAVLSAMQEIPDKELIRQKRAEYEAASVKGKKALRKANREWAYLYDNCDQRIAAGEEVGQPVEPLKF